MCQSRDHAPIYHALPRRTSLAHQTILREKQDAVLGMGQMCVGRNPAGSRYGVFGVYEDIGGIQVDASTSGPILSIRRTNSWVVLSPCVSRLILLP